MANENPTPRSLSSMKGSPTRSPRKKTTDEFIPRYTRSIQIHDLNTNRVEVREPFQVEVEFYSGEVVATIPELDLWASETTESEALLSVKSALLNLWDDLRQEDDDKLGKLPQMWKRIIGRRVKTIV